jgi:hypothetical protein
MWKFMTSAWNIQVWLRAIAPQQDKAAADVMAVAKNVPTCGGRDIRSAAPLETHVAVGH